MTDRVRDARGVYQLASELDATQQAHAELRFDKGTLLLEHCAQLPTALNAYFTFDPRVNAYRAPAHYYADLIKPLRPWLRRNRAPHYGKLLQTPALQVQLYPHQKEALQYWHAAGRRGLVVLPTGAGKTLVGLFALSAARRDTLIVVPTLDLLHQWYALARAAFPDLELGLMGGGYHEICSLTIATYDSAARHIDRLGNRFGLLICDEAHHLPAEFYRCIAEFSLAPYRLGLSATPERGDNKHLDFPTLLGPVVYRKTPQELAGDVLAPFQIRTIPVELSPSERLDYERLLAERDNFLRENNIRLGSLEGWNRFVMRSAGTSAGRRAMLAHREARRIAHAAPAKLRALAAVLASHRTEKTVIFTDDNATAYEVSQRFLIPCITHQTRVKERQAILEYFKSGDYTALVSSRVLNEGVDVPDAAIGVVMSGTGSNREFIQRLGRILRRSKDKQAILYEIVARDTREEHVLRRRRQSADTAASPELPLFPDEK
ncbi:MAG: DEAD/DEAH box helicase family protein [Candidatus Competibacteraceae bacterium]|nr:DEAD/DEAH box helicase family protein [Candidatus Competibacteraceae bacterium]MCB1806503.1 DEAD/DEAH box helicase family protein [Candidatus Competibacteraceae bacterium]